MIHSNDLDDFRSSYRRSTDKTLDISHQVYMDSVKKAFYSIVDKNCGETAIKTFLDLHIQGGRPVSKQADTVRQQIGDIIPKTFTIKTSHACSCAQ